MVAIRNVAHRQQSEFTCNISATRNSSNLKKGKCINLSSIRLGAARNILCEKVFNLLPLGLSLTIAQASAAQTLA